MFVRSQSYVLHPLRLPCDSQQHPPSLHNARGPEKPVTYYQDDLVCHGKGHEAHVEASTAMFTVLRNAGLQIKLDKTTIGARAINLGE